MTSCSNVIFKILSHSHTFRHFRSYDVNLICFGTWIKAFFSRGLILCCMGGIFLSRFLGRGSQNGV